MKAILRLMLENINSERTANAVANKEMLLVGDVVTTHSPTNPSPPSHDSRFLVDTHRLTVKAILRLMLEQRTIERTANAVA